MTPARLREIATYLAESGDEWQEGAAVAMRACADAWEKAEHELAITQTRLSERCECVFRGIRWPGYFEVADDPLQTRECVVHRGLTADLGKARQERSRRTEG
jgi:hypothetical protein